MSYKHLTLNKNSFIYTQKIQGNKLNFDHNINKIFKSETIHDRINNLCNYYKKICSKRTIKKKLTHTLKENLLFFFIGIFLVFIFYLI